MNKFAILFISCFLAAKIHADDLETDKVLEQIFNDYRKHLFVISKHLHIKQFFGFIGNDRKSKEAVRDYLLEEKKLRMSLTYPVDLESFKEFIKVVSKIQDENKDVATFANECFNKATGSKNKGEASTSVEDDLAANELLESIFNDYRRHISAAGNYLNKQQFYRFLGDDEYSKSLIEDQYLSKMEFDTIVQSIKKAKSSFRKSFTLDTVDVEDFKEYMKLLSKAHNKDVATFANDCFKKVTSSTQGGLTVEKQLETIFNKYRKRLGTVNDYLDMQQFFEFLGDDEKSKNVVLNFLGQINIEEAMKHTVDADKFVLYMSVVSKAHSNDNDVVTFANECFNKATHSKTTKNEAATSVQSGLTENEALGTIFDEYRRHLKTVAKYIPKEKFFVEFLGNDEKYRKAVDEYLKKKRLELANQPIKKRKDGHLYSAALDTMNLDQFRMYMEVVFAVYNKNTKDVVTFAKECLENAKRPKIPTTEMGKIKL